MRGEVVSFSGLSPKSSSAETRRTLAQIHEQGRGRLVGLGFVVGDHALGDAHGFAQLGLGEAAALANRRQALAEAFQSAILHRVARCR